LAQANHVMFPFGFTSGSCDFSSRLGMHSCCSSQPAIPRRWRKASCENHNACQVEKECISTSNAGEFIADHQEAIPSLAVASTDNEELSGQRMQQEVQQEHSVVKARHRWRRPHQADNLAQRRPRDLHRGHADEDKDAVALALEGLCPRAKLSLSNPARMLIMPELAHDFNSVLEGGAHHLKSIFCAAGDCKLFEQLREEIEDSGYWRSRGLDKYERTIAPEGGLRSTGRISGEDAVTLARLPAHSYVLDRLTGLFNSRALSWWINLYPTGSDSKNFHKDNFGQNITIGASFGATRSLTFRHGRTGDEFHFPQENGDVFAFREKVNNVFLHGMHPLRTRDPDPGPRISVIVMGRARPA